MMELQWLIFNEISDTIFVCLFNFQILREDGDRVYVHWVGWGSKYDSWINKSDIISKDEIPQPAEAEVGEGEGLSPEQTFFTRLRYETKKRLKVGYKSSAVVRMRLDCPRSALNTLKRTNHTKEGSRLCFSNSDLTGLLGANWHVRILNKERDFVHVVDGSVTIQVSKNRSYKEYMIADNGTLEEVKGSSGLGLSMRFVRIESTSQELSAIMTS